jgi:hypothetical protein
MTFLAQILCFLLLYKTMLKIYPTDSRFLTGRDKCMFLELQT